MKYIPYFILLMTIVSTMAGCSSDNNSWTEEPPVNDSLIVINENEECNRWIYSSMNKHYYWREDLPDSASCNYALSAQEFFKSLLSPKDRFSYTKTNENYKPSLSSYFGLEWQPIVDSKGKKAAIVVYVDKAIRSYGIRRGDYIEIVDNDYYNLNIRKVQLDINNNFIYSDKEIISIKAVNKPSTTVLCDSVYHIGVNRIGYMCYLQYEQIQDLNPSLKKFFNEGITDLILDVRYNPGGLVKTMEFLVNRIVKNTAYGKLLQQQEYNEILSQERLKKYGEERQSSYYQIITNTPEDNPFGSDYPLNLPRLFVLTSKNTASASEATIMHLRPYIEVITIGETTRGKGVGSYTISNPRYKLALQPITFRYYNANGISTPDEGITPDYYIPDGYTTSHKDIGEIEEPMLNFAIALITGNSISSEFLSTNRYDNHNLPQEVGEPSYVTKYKQKQYYYGN